MAMEAFMTTPTKDNEQMGILKLMKTPMDIKMFIKILYYWIISKMRI
jgi:hypothetical protein